MKIHNQPKKIFSNYKLKSTIKSKMNKKRINKNLSLMWFHFIKIRPSDHTPKLEVKISNK